MEAKKKTVKKKGKWKSEPSAVPLPHTNAFRDDKEGGEGGDFYLFIFLRWHQ